MNSPPLDFDKNDKGWGCFSAVIYAFLGDVRFD